MDKTLEIIIPQIECVCADEVSVDAKGLFVREALCYGYLGKLLYSYRVKYSLVSVL